jgi:hypothetical protein
MLSIYESNVTDLPVQSACMDQWCMFPPCRTAPVSATGSVSAGSVSGGGVGSDSKMSEVDTAPVGEKLGGSTPVGLTPRELRLSYFAVRY